MGFASQGGQLDAVKCGMSGGTGLGLFSLLANFTSEKFIENSQMSAFASFFAPMRTTYLSVYRV